jgi:hypothetical protein
MGAQSGPDDLGEARRTERHRTGALGAPPGRPAACRFVQDPGSRSPQGQAYRRGAPGPAASRAAADVARRKRTPGAEESSARTTGLPAPARTISDLRVAQANLASGELRVPANQSPTRPVSSATSAALRARRCMRFPAPAATTGASSGCDRGLGRVDRTRLHSGLLGQERDDERLMTRASIILPLAAACRSLIALIARHPDRRARLPLSARVRARPPSTWDGAKVYAPWSFVGWYMALRNRAIQQAVRSWPRLARLGRRDVRRSMLADRC